MDKIKQHEIITIRGNRVVAGQVLILVSDMVQSVFSLGLFRVVCGVTIYSRAKSYFLTFPLSPWVYSNKPS